MLSSDRSEHGADRRRRRAGRTRSRSGTAEDGPPPADGAVRDARLDPDGPWDASSAELLTRVYESEEGNLSRPPASERVEGEHRSPPFLAAVGAAGSGDCAWLEAHLTGLVERLNEVLARADPEATLAALSGRLEDVEQRFAAALDRVAQRADLEGLHAIETQVLELAGQLEHARDRLDRIGAIDEQIRALARKMEETGEERTGPMEKLLRDSIAEWRESERRTAGALHNLEQAVNRLGDSVDAMEASKPAPDLSVPPPLRGTDQAQADTLSPFHAIGGLSQPYLYHGMLDAADYAPRPAAPEGLRPFEELAATLDEQAEFASDAVSWPGLSGSGDGRAAGANLTPGASHAMALRAKLRRSSRVGRRISRFPFEDGPPPLGAFWRAARSLLFVAVGALLAGSTYFAYQTYVQPAPDDTPAIVEPGGLPGDAKSDLADPTGRRIDAGEAG
jgi:hypothetical protein